MKHQLIDHFGYLKELKKKKVKFIANNFHWRARRYEIPAKQSAMSDGRVVASVWANWNQLKGHPKVPWIVFKNKKNITSQVREILNATSHRPAIRVGVFSF